MTAPTNKTANLFLFFLRFSLICALLMLTNSTLFSGILADLSNEPVMKFDQSDDFDSDEIFF